MDLWRRRSAQELRAAYYVWDIAGTTVSKGERVMALSFDDGPSDATTAVLDELDRLNAPATFFMVGWEAAHNPDTVAEVARRGHRVENHTWSHTRLTKLRERPFARAIDKTTSVLEEITARRVTLVRPPFGALDRRTLERLDTRGLSTVLWSLDPRDWSRPGVDAIVSTTLDKLHPGAIVLFHVGKGDCSQTIAALAPIVEEARSRGYDVVSI